ncbi:MAG: SGNH/GDSL hydrolase family protein [Chloroflexota bacterium]|nr:MAG: GDSL family lipase [Chloroflexota bacterium]
MPRIQENAVVLFQGDSITDAGRLRDDPEHMGGGYAALAAAWFSARFPERRVRFLNRGISGNRTADLRARWQRDCIDLRPDWVSILIGINDTWRRYDRSDPTSTEAFAANYRAILEHTRAETSAQLILCEPFVLPVPPDRRAWREDLDPKIAVVRDLAREFGALLVPLDGIFASASTRREPAFWAPDGVHPSQAGHALIAQAWLAAVGAL